jgi:hypothetical protein
MLILELCIFDETTKARRWDRTDRYMQLKSGRDYVKTEVT